MNNQGPTIAPVLRKSGGNRFTLLTTLHNGSYVIRYAIQRDLLVSANYGSVLKLEEDVARFSRLTTGLSPSNNPITNCLAAIT
jgi:hypothetical protein